MLKIKNISYVLNSDGKEKNILNNFSFEFKKGKNYVITGSNGCGKSTLAKIIMGILQPTSGSIILNGEDITNFDITQRAKLGIAYAMQQPVKFKGLKVKDLLQYAYGDTLSTSNACEYLSKVGLCARDYLNRELDNTLSGGELKRIEIAGILARDCKVNIFDEPEAGIDIWSFNSLVDIFKSNIKDDAVNIIISHQEKIFLSADEIILIDGGKVVASGVPSEILPQISQFKSCKKIEEINNG